MLHRESGDGKSVPLRDGPGRKLAVNDLEGARQGAECGVETFEQRLRALPDARRTEDLERLRAAIHKHPIEKQERQASKVVAMAMAYHDGVDAGDRDTCAFESKGRVRSAIQQQAAP